MRSNEPLAWETGVRAWSFASVSSGPGQLSSDYEWRASLSMETTHGREPSLTEEGEGEDKDGHGVIL